MQHLFARLCVFTALTLAASAQHPPAIASISVCSPAGHGGPGNCPPGSSDTQQIVLGPGGGDVNDSSLLVGPVPDEHSTIYAPGTLGGNHDYLFFVASPIAHHAAIGMSVLSGGSGPDGSGQWTLDFPYTDGYGLYPSGFGQVFDPSTKGGTCPVAPNHDATQQDQTFDMHYAAGGSILKDPTAHPGSLLMIYEGTNACIGNAGGDIASTDNDYISMAVATSLDYGRSWPAYRGTPTFDFVPLPGFNLTEGPNAPMGALGSAVCMGTDCSTTPPSTYGRYPIVTPPVSLATLMAAGQKLPAKYGEQEISGFVDDAAPGPQTYVYALSGDIRVSRALLNGGSAPLAFRKWDSGSGGWNSPGLSGSEATVLPSGSAENCADANHNRFGGSISFVEETRQYLLLFVCVDFGQKGTAAWFWSTSYDLSNQDSWTPPLEVEGSRSPIDNTGGCADFAGWYPSAMSLHRPAGRLGLEGHIFYLWGCQGSGTPNGRRFASRQFTIQAQ